MVHLQPPRIHCSGLQRPLSCSPETLQSNWICKDPGLNGWALSEQSQDGLTDQLDAPGTHPQDQSRTEAKRLIRWKLSEPSTYFHSPALHPPPSLSVTWWMTLLGLWLTPSPSPLPCHTSLSWSFFSCLLLDQHLFESYSLIMGFLSGSVIKILPTIQETRVQFLGQENPLEEGVTAPSSILAGKNPMDRGAWQAIVTGLQRVRNNWSSQAAAAFTHCFF